jgi:hypothetical protein
MGTPIYKIEEYVMWDSKSPVIGIGIGGGFTIPPVIPPDSGGDSLWEIVYDGTDNILQPIQASDSIDIDIISLPANTIYVGDSAQLNSEMFITARGTASVVNLVITAESSAVGGEGGILIGDNGVSNITLSSTSSLIIHSPSITLGDTGLAHNIMATILPAENSTGTGSDVGLYGGVTYQGDSYRGGDLYLSGGNSWDYTVWPPVAGIKGDIYFAKIAVTGGALKAKTAETNVVYYDETTGLLSYGDGSGLTGGDLWQETSGHLEPVTAGEDVYAHDFILIP